MIHILSKVSCFLLKSFHFRRDRNDRFFFPYKSLYFECYATMPMLADAHILSLGYLWEYGAIASIITLTDETDKCTKKPVDAPIRGRTNDLVG